MKPYPFELLNHLTVPRTYLLLLMETWMFLSAANWCNKLPPTAINCAECTRMRLSVKRAFFSAVSKKERFFEYKNVSVGKSDFPEALWPPATTSEYRVCCDRWA